MSKALVAYFSTGGVTRKVAEELAKVEKADLFEIRPEKLYTARRNRLGGGSGDLDCRTRTVMH